MEKIHPTMGFDADIGEEVRIFFFFNFFFIFYIVVDFVIH